MSRNYKFLNREGLYFISFATVGWMDVFTRKEYKDL
ncbi:MAG: transposase, partial [Flavisolibacter sp.]|nr:transposase [Flavisolibacter sp.]